MAFVPLLWAMVLTAEGPRPAWWDRLMRLERLESAFVQESESAIFGTLSRKGTLRLAQGGRIRIVYETGSCLVSDGRTLVHYDPATRTAQRFELQAAAREAPLLTLLLDPIRVQQIYRVRVESGGKLHLEPRQPGLPVVEAEGRAGFLERISWVDPTGAKQVLRLIDPRVPSAFPEGTFALKIPSGTRWLP